MFWSNGATRPTGSGHPFDRVNWSARWRETPSRSAISAMPTSRPPNTGCSGASAVTTSEYALGCPPGHSRTLGLRPCRAPLACVKLASGDIGWGGPVQEEELPMPMRDRDFELVASSIRYLRSEVQSDLDQSYAVDGAIVLDRLTEQLADDFDARYPCFKRDAFRVGAGALVARTAVSRCLDPGECVPGGSLANCIFAPPHVASGQWGYLLGTPLQVIYVEEGRTIAEIKCVDMQDLVTIRANRNSALLSIRMRSGDRWEFDCLPKFAQQAKKHFKRSHPNREVSPLRSFANNASSPCDGSHTA
jgi:hypothetical protein